MLSPESTRKTQVTHNCENYVSARQRTQILCKLTSCNEYQDKLFRITKTLMHESSLFLDENIFYLEDKWQDILTEDLLPRTKLQQSAIWELLATERTYIMRLKIIVKLFMETFRRMQKHGELRDFHESDIFSNVLDILKINERYWIECLLPILKRVRNDRNRILPNELLTFHSDYFNFNAMFEIYGTYCLTEDTRVKFVQDIINSNPYFEGSMENIKNNNITSDDKFNLWLHWCQCLASCDRLKLKDLLAEPRLRLCRYSLLFGRILKNTSESNEIMHIERFLKDCEDCLISIDKSIEERIKQKELVSCILELEEETSMKNESDWNQKSYFHYTDFLCLPIKTKTTPALRYILHRSSMNLIKESKREKVEVFLFSDVLFLAKLNNENKKYTIIRRPYFLPKLNLLKSKKGTRAVVVLYLDEFGLLADSFSLETSASKIDDWISIVERAKLCFCNVNAGIGSTLDFFFDSSSSSETATYANEKLQDTISNKESDNGSDRKSEYNILDIGCKGIGYYDAQTLLEKNTRTKRTVSSRSSIDSSQEDIECIKVSSKFEASFISLDSTKLYPSHVNHSFSSIPLLGCIDKETQTEFLPYECTNKFCYLVNHVCD